MNSSDLSRSKLPRIPMVDVLRGVALVAMAIYHFTWDLEFFGWLRPQFIIQPEWIFFARSIATSFLFLVGISLFLAHGNGIRWSSFRKRILQVIAAAAVISAVTWYVFPDGFIFFGILHGIALFSLLGLFFVRLHWLVSITAAVVIFSVWKFFSHEVFAHPALWWVGLAPVAPPSNDYVPLFPWFAAVLIGIAVAKMASSKTWSKLASISFWSPVQRPLSFIGRNSLVFYLVHQPVLLGLLWVFTTFVAQPDRTEAFVYQCNEECSATSSPLFCKSYCVCMVDTLKEQQLFTPFLKRELDADKTKQLYAVRDLCVAAQK